ARQAASRTPTAIRMRLVMADPRGASALPFSAPAGAAWSSQGRQPLGRRPFCLEPRRGGMGTTSAPMPPLRGSIRGGGAWVPGAHAPGYTMPPLTGLKTASERLFSGPTGRAGFRRLGDVGVRGTALAGSARLGVQQGVEV